MLGGLLVLGIAASGGSAAVSPVPAFTPVRILQTTEGVFPVGLESQARSGGKVSAVINVDVEGNLADCFVSSYTHEAFARAAMEALHEWRYEPARERGEPIGTRAEVVFDFEVRGSVVNLTGVEQLGTFIDGLMGPTTTRCVVRPAELDGPIICLERIEPFHPGSLMGSRSPGGEVLLDFYIDQRGNPRMPVVISADDIWFARAAVQALEQWRFAPPTCQGRPVIVRATQRFRFAGDS